MVATPSTDSTFIDTSVYIFLFSCVLIGLGFEPMVDILIGICIKQKVNLGFFKVDNSYPDDWDKRRRKVYKRDSFECQNCGRKGGHKRDLHSRRFKSNMVSISPLLGLNIWGRGFSVTE